MQAVLGQQGVTCVQTSVLLRNTLVPRPSPPLVFDRLQYVKTEGEGLVNLTTLEFR